jgi:hypothetical protein
MNKAQVVINSLDRGYIIKAGCKEIAFNGSVDELLSKVKEYLLDPYAAYQKYFPEDFADKEKRSVDVAAAQLPREPLYNRGSYTAQTESGGY